MNFNKKEESSSLERFIATLDNEILSDSEAVSLTGGRFIVFATDGNKLIKPTNQQECVNGNCGCNDRCH